MVAWSSEGAAESNQDGRTDFHRLANNLLSEFPSLFFPPRFGPCSLSHKLYDPVSRLKVPGCRVLLLDSFSPGVPLTPPFFFVFHRNFFLCTFLCCFSACPSEDKGRACLGFYFFFFDRFFSWFHPDLLRRLRNPMSEPIFRETF